MIDFPSIPDVTGVAINSEIHVCRDIPWDSEYKNVRLFTDREAAWNYVTSKEIYSFTCTTVKNSKIRVSGTYSTDLAVSNYLCFKNNNNMFFAFIMDIAYISNTVIELTYKLDIFQTYFYNCTMKPCFVEREHINRSEDVIGANTLPEPVSTGEYRMYRRETVDYNEMRVLVYTTAPNGTGGVEMYKGGLNGVFSGINVFSGTNITIAVKLALLITAGKEDSIVQILMCPTYCGDIEDVSNPVSGTTKNISIAPGSLYDGYNPVNKKLYTNPFCFCEVDNNSGGMLELHFELSDNTDKSVEIAVTGCLCMIPTIISYPVNYNSLNSFVNESITHSNFPVCATAGNSYAQWLNSNNITLGAAAQAQAMKTELASLSNIAQGAVGGISNALQGNIAGVVNSAVGTGLAQAGINLNQDVFNLTMEAQYKQAAQKPNAAIGSVGSANINTAINRNQTDLLGYGITDYKSVDDFFSVYGYTTKKVKIPNMNNRNLWNYVQTTNCTLTGTCANNYLVALQSIFNKGVFIWHTNDVGNFNVTANG